MAWTPPRTWVDGELVTASLMNTHLRDNFNALVSPPSQQIVRDNDANYTTTSTTFVDIDSTNLSITLTATGGAPACTLWLWFMGSVVGNAVHCFDFAIDGGDGGGMIQYIPGGAKAGLVVMNAMYPLITAGTYTFRPRWRVPSATGVLYCGATVDTPVVFGVREI